MTQHVPGPERRWNHNTHFHARVLDAVPDGANTALDVGTGNGLLARDLSDGGLDVTAIDLDADALRATRSASADTEIHWLHGDVMRRDFGQQFDVVASVATVRHLPDLSAALAWLADLTAPGGALVVVGLAKPTRLRDHVLGLADVAQHRWSSWRRGYWEHSAPTCWPPSHSPRSSTSRAQS